MCYLHMAGASDGRVQCLVSHPLQLSVTRAQRRLRAGRRWRMLTTEALWQRATSQIAAVQQGTAAEAAEAKATDETAERGSAKEYGSDL